MNHLHGDHPSGGDITKTKETPDNEAFVKLQKTWTKKQWDAFEEIKVWARIPKDVDMTQYSND